MRKETASMKITAILGSRDHVGRTAKAAEALLQGAAAEGAESTEAFLPEMKVERCRQCQDDGWGLCRSEGRCVIDDDLAVLVEQIRGSDAVVFANPVYFSDLSESMRAFLDRLRRICRHESGKAGIEGKPAVGICVAGGGGGGAPACAVALEKVLTTCGFAVVDMIPARRQNLDLKLQVLGATGRWLAAAQGQRASS
jgi:multimeric flavodoxin WrbA